MKLESEPIADDEWLLRRVHKDFFQDACDGIQAAAFRPRVTGRDPDFQGISLYRSDCLTSPVVILQNVPDDRRCQLGIVQISAGFIRSLGLSIVPDPDVSICGHVVIPELSSVQIKIEKARITELMIAMAAVASEPANILLRPSPQAP